MPNRKYKKGYEKERRIVLYLKNNGFELAFRSAGSHSPVDVFGLNTGSRVIKLIQSKSDKMSESAKNKLLEELKRFEGQYMVVVEVK